jgi:TRAP transporter 4TM/12TM fusion protein
VIFLALGYSAVKAVFWSIVLMICVSWMGKPQYRMTPKRLLDALIAGGMGAVEVAAACACSGLVIGVIGITGIGLAFSSFVISLSQGILPLALILTMIGSIILGMGVPTTAQYIITSTLAAPALYQMGVPLMSAHLFCLYFGVLADVTPPVALATYAAAGIAKSNAMKTGFTALVTAMAGFLVPYMFVYNPHLLFQGNIFQIAFSFITALMAIIGLSAGVQGYYIAPISIPERIALLIVPFLLIVPNLTTDIAALAILVGVYVLQRVKAKKNGAPVPESTQP